jgi:hypothetical protein
MIYGKSNQISNQYLIMSFIYLVFMTANNRISLKYLKQTYYEWK